MKYCDRNGHRWESSSGQDCFLAKMYGCPAGRGLMKMLTHPAISKIGGKLLSSRISRGLIAPFVKRQGIDLKLYEERDFHSYNDFFTRKIKPKLRPVEMAPSVLISPCDGKLSAYPISGDQIFYIKNSAYTVESLTRSKKLARRFAGGWCVLIRLTVDDYHRYCYVDSGNKTKNYRIPGFLHTVNPAAVATVPVYKENAREFTLIQSPNFGTILQMEVGAMMVGKITNHQGEGPVIRGEEKGYFEFGGSTVILLLEGGRVAIDDDLCQNTKEGYETRVRLGETIGHQKPGECQALPPKPDTGFDGG